MFDFSSFNSNLEGSSLQNVIIIALISFALSSLIALVYEKTSQGIEKPRFYIQSLILISIPVATVMQAIGDSLARGLGMLGALAIIRFRTTLRNPRNMIFMFASIAVGIAAGVYGIAISVIGTIAFCLVVCLIHFSKLNKDTTVFGYLRFNMAEPINKEGVVISGLNNTIKKETLEVIIASYCKKITLIKYEFTNSKRQRINFEYKIQVSNKDKAIEAIDALSKYEVISNIRIDFNNDYEKI